MWLSFLSLWPAAFLRVLAGCCGLGRRAGFPALPANHGEVIRYVHPSLVAEKISVISLARDGLKRTANAHCGMQFGAVMWRNLKHLVGLDCSLLICGSTQGGFEGNFFSGVFRCFHIFVCLCFVFHHDYTIPNRLRYCKNCLTL